MKSALTQIRSAAIGKANTLQRAARHLETLRPAFAEWASGDIYVCKKTGEYRYRFDERSKSIAPWSKTAREVFASPEAFAFAAMVLADKQPSEPAPAPVVRNSNVSNGNVSNGNMSRANIIALATRRAA
jgi:hypothetical protein